MPDITKLGQAVKASHPGKYDDVTDEALGLAVQRAHPGKYDDFTPLTGNDQLAQREMNRSTIGALQRQMGRKVKEAFPGRYDDVEDEILGKAANLSDTNILTAHSPADMRAAVEEPKPFNAGDTDFLKDPAGALARKVNAVMAGGNVGVMQGVRGVGGLLRTAGTLRDSGNPIVSPIRPVMAEIGREMVNFAERNTADPGYEVAQGRMEKSAKFSLQADPIQNPEIMTTPEFWLYQIGQGAGSGLSMLAGGLGAARLGAGWGGSLLASTAMETAMNSGNVAQDALKAGAKPEIAAQAAARSAMVDLPASLVLNRLGIHNDSIRNFAKRGAVSMGTEALQEGIQEVAQNWGARAFEPGRDLMQGVGAAMIGGGVGGAFTGPVYRWTEMAAEQTGRAVPEMFRPQETLLAADPQSPTPGTGTLEPETAGPATGRPEAPPPTSPSPESTVAPTSPGQPPVVDAAVATPEQVAIVREYVRTRHNADKPAGWRTIQKGVKLPDDVVREALGALRETGKIDRVNRWKATEAEDTATVEPVADPVEPVADPVEPVADPVEPVADPVADPAEPVQPIEGPVRAEEEANASREPEPEMAPTTTAEPVAEPPLEPAAPADKLTPRRPDLDPITPPQRPQLPRPTLTPTPDPKSGPAPDPPLAAPVPVPASPASRDQLVEAILSAVERLESAPGNYVSVGSIRKNNRVIEALKFSDDPLTAFEDAVRSLARQDRLMMIPFDGLQSEVDRYRSDFILPRNGGRAFVAVAHPHYTRDAQLKPQRPDLEPNADAAPAPNNPKATKPELGDLIIKPLLGGKTEVLIPGSKTDPAPEEPSVTNVPGEQPESGPTIRGKAKVRARKRFEAARPINENADAAAAPADTVEKGVDDGDQNSATQGPGTLPQRPAGTDAVRGVDERPRTSLGPLESELPQDAVPADQPRDDRDAGEGARQAVVRDGESVQRPAGAPGSDRALPDDRPQRRPSGLTPEDDPQANLTSEPEPEPEPPARPFARDYRLTTVAEQAVTEGGSITRARRNIDAIKLLNEIADGVATPEQQERLASYVGWGGLKSLFRKYEAPWIEFRRELASRLSIDEYNAADASKANAHYTSFPVIRAMWQGLQALGAKSGMRYVEPSMGVGNFFAAMPESLLPRSTRIGVEKDSITGRIAKALYPDSDIHVAGFEDVKIPNDYAHVVVGNVPFGNFGVADRNYKGQDRRVASSIHNYFIVRSLDILKPGGVAMLITSHNTLDQQDAYFRERMFARADLIDAFRLPSTAFEENASTQVVTDILVFHKRQIGEKAPEARPSWLDSAPMRPAGFSQDIPISKWFQEHPEKIFGGFTEGGLYGASGYKLAGSLDVRQLAELFASLPKVLETGRSAERRAVSLNQWQGDANALRDGEIVEKDSKIWRREGVEMIEVPASKAQIPRFRSYAKVRAALRSLYAAEIQDRPEEEITAARQSLRSEYDAFVKAHGPLNTSANEKALFDDPDSTSVLALEDYDSQAKTVRRLADVFTKRTLYAPRILDRAESIEHAVSYSLAITGDLDWAFIADKLGVPEAQAQQAAMAADLVFEDPVGGLVMKSRYLSGDVKTKAEVAEIAARQEPKFQRNVEALRAVIPPTIPFERISTAPGQSWIPPEIYQAFVKQIGGNADVEVTVEQDPLGRWRVDTSRHMAGWSKYDVVGDNRSVVIRGPKVFERMMNYGSSTYKRTVSTGGSTITVVDENATQNLRRIMAELPNVFRKWLESKPKATERLQDLFNQRFNRFAQEQVDGSHLTFPGMAAGIKLRSYQKNAVARIIQHGTALLNHVVGAGKTMTMVAAGMEMKRLGLVNKPLYLVLKPTFGQWRQAFGALYPNARVLFIDPDDIGDKRARARYVAQISSNAYDAIVMHHETFGRLPFTEETVNGMIDSMLEDARAAIEDMRRNGDSSRSTTMRIRSLESRLENEETKLRDAFKRRREDESLGSQTFESLGIDFLFVDESHKFKKPGVQTKMSDVKNVDTSLSYRAFHLFVATRYLLDRFKGRGVVFATGTPLTNTMAELYNLQRYLQPTVMEKMGFSRFDDWAAQFGRIVSEFEIPPEGSGQLVETARFREFQNMAQLRQMVGQFADTVTREDMLATGELKLPSLATGAAQVIQSQTHPTAWDNVLRWLKGRANKIRARRGPPKPGDDIMALVNNDAMDATLDIRHVPPSVIGAPGEFADNKVNSVVTNVVSLWRRSAESRGVQALFLDRSIMKEHGGRESQGFSMYRAIRDGLIAQGIPADQIALIYDFEDEDSQRALFEAVNDGRIRVVMGSSSKLGTGTNIQQRLLAIHHIDVPHLPAELEQRDGRGIRQGNTNPEVHVFFYVSEQSPDAKRMQDVLRKQAFIQDFWRGKGFSDTIEELDSVSEGLIEGIQKATDPKAARLLTLSARIRQKEGERAAWLASAQNQRDELRNMQRSVDSWRRSLAERQQALEWMKDKELGTFATAPVRVGSVVVAEGAVDKAKLIALAYNGSLLDKPFASIGPFELVRVGYSMVAKTGVHSINLLNALPANLDTTEPELKSLAAKLARAYPSIEKVQEQIAAAAEEIRFREANVQTMSANPSGEWSGQKELDDLRQEQHDLRAEAREKEEAAKKAKNSEEDGQPAAAREHGDEPVITGQPNARLRMQASAAGAKLKQPKWDHWKRIDEAAADADWLVRPATGDRPTILWMNTATAELLRRVFGMGRFDALSIGPRDARVFAQNAGDMASAYPQIADKLLGLAEVLAQHKELIAISAVSARGGKPMEFHFQMFRHEMLHWVQSQLGGGVMERMLSHGAMQRLADLPAAQTARRELLSLGYGELVPARLVQETAAYIGAGQRQTLRITDDDAVDFLDQYFALIARDYGRDAVARMMRLLAPEIRGQMRPSALPEPIGPRSEPGRELMARGPPAARAGDNGEEREDGKTERAAESSERPADRREPGQAGRGVASWRKAIAQGSPESDRAVAEALGKGFADDTFPAAALWRSEREELLSVEEVKKIAQDSGVQLGKARQVLRDLGYHPRSMTADQAKTFLLALRRLGMDREFLGGFRTPSRVLRRSVNGWKIWRKAEQTHLANAEAVRHYTRAATDILSGLSTDDRQTIEHYRIARWQQAYGQEVELPELTDKQRQANDRITAEITDPIWRQALRAGFVEPKRFIEDYITFFHDKPKRPTDISDRAYELAKDTGLDYGLAAQILENAAEKNVRFGPFDLSRKGVNTKRIGLDKWLEVYIKGSQRKVYDQDFLDYARGLVMRIPTKAMRRYATAFINQFVGKRNVYEMGMIRAGVEIANSHLRAVGIQMSPDGLAASLAAWQYYAKIGLNPSSPIVNTVGGFRNQFAWHGFDAFHPARIARVAGVTAASLVLPEHSNPLRDEIRRLEAQGVLDSFLVEFERPMHHSSLSWLGRSLSVGMRMSEEFMRINAFYAAEDRARQEGADQRAALQAGRDAVRETMGVTGRLDTPLFARSPEGRLVMQFKVFATKDLELFLSLKPQQKARFVLASVALGGPSAIMAREIVRLLFPGSDLERLIEEWEQSFSLAALLHAEHLGRQFGMANLIPGVENLGAPNSGGRALRWIIGPTLASLYDTADGAVKMLAAKANKGTISDRQIDGYVTRLLRAWVPTGATLVKLEKAIKTTDDPVERLRIVTNMAKQEKPFAVPPELLKMLEP